MDRIKIFFLCLVSVYALSDARHMLGKQIGNEGKLPVRNEFKSSANMSAIEASDEEIMEVIKLCNTTYPIPAEYLTQLNETGRYPANADHNSKCYLFCLLSGTKMVDGKGNVNPSDIGKLFTDEEELMQCDSIKKCLTEEKQNKDVCEETYERISCFIKGRIDCNNKNSDGM